MKGCKSCRGGSLKSTAKKFAKSDVGRALIGQAKGYAKKQARKKLNEFMGGRKKMGLGKAIQKTARRIGKTGASKKIGRALTKKALEAIEKL